MTDRRSFSHAIAEGDGISVIAAVDDPDSARSAEAQRAEALVVRSDPRPIRRASSLPILWRAEVSIEEAVECADAVLIVFEDDDDRVDDLHRQAIAQGLASAVEVRREEDVEAALERIDPEIFLLSPVDGDDDETPLEVVLDLLAAVPAGKLVIADLPLVTPRETEELEQAGCDAVIVSTSDIAALAGDVPPDV
jgi:indole-3-glycerol phosphate synthase